jgi:SH3 domain protein
MAGRVSPRRAAAFLALAAPLALLASESRAERAWVKDELRLNLRTGPGVQYRIRGAVKTGDAVEILSRGDSWTQIRVDEIGEGWIPVGYLQPTAPASLQLAQSEAEAAELRERVATLSRDATELRSANQTLSERDEGQKAEIERLVRENLKLRAGARWPEWIAGACILSVGMIIGSILHRNATRRKTSRIRL